MHQRISRYELRSMRLHGGVTHAVRHTDGTRTLCGLAVNADDWTEETDEAYGRGRTGCGRCLASIYGNGGRGYGAAARKRI